MKNKNKNYRNYKKLKFKLIIFSRNSFWFVFREILKNNLKLIFIVNNL